MIYYNYVDIAPSLKDIYEVEEVYVNNFMWFFLINLSNLILKYNYILFY